MLKVDLARQRVRTLSEFPSCEASWRMERALLHMPERLETTKDPECARIKLP
jgi:hypothetical protein